MFDIKNYLSRENILFTPEASESSKLQALLNPMLEQKLGTAFTSGQVPRILWDATRYGLQKSSLYSKLDLEQQSSILERLTELNQALTFWIEKSGLHYGAKMVLLSEDMESKTLYSFFMAEEAAHFQGFKRFMSFIPDWERHQHPMLGVLSRAISDGSRETLIFVIQVLLEGFGLQHYQGLRDTCVHAPLRDLFTDILRDEAKHHGMGVVQTQALRSHDARSEDDDQIFELTRDFIRSLQNAHWIKKAVEEVRGPMSAHDENKFWDELRFDQVIGARNQRLREMIEKVGHTDLVQRLITDRVLA